MSLDSKPSEIFYGLALRAMRTEVLRDVERLVELAPEEDGFVPGLISKEDLVAELQKMRGGE